MEINKEGLKRESTGRSKKKMSRGRRLAEHPSATNTHHTPPSPRRDRIHRSSSPSTTTRSPSASSSSYRPHSHAATRPHPNPFSPPLSERKRRREMAPRITLHASASSSASINGRAPPASAPTSSAGSAKGKTAETETEMDVDEVGSDAHDGMSPPEIDELDDSDADGGTQPEWATLSPTASASGPASTGTAKAGMKRQRAKPPTSRTPGQSIVPVNRIESIVQADGMNGTPSKEASFIIALATEEFIRRLTRVAHSRSRFDKRPLTYYSDFADAAYYFEEYKFLQEIMPRAMTPKAALAERKRIMEYQESLLNGPEANGTHRSRSGQASASTSKAGTPIPRLSKPNGNATPNAGTSASTNGKATAKSKPATPSTAAPTPAPTVRSERQRNKKARIAYESEAQSELRGSMAPPPSPAVNGNGSASDLAASGLPSTSTNGNGSVKIKIRPRVASAAPIAAPKKPAPPPEILALGPPAGLKSSLPRSTSLKSESEHSKSAPHSEGAMGSAASVNVKVQENGNGPFASVSLPAPPSAKVAKSSPKGEQGDADHTLLQDNSVPKENRTIVKPVATAAEKKKVGWEAGATPGGALMMLQGTETERREKEEARVEVGKAVEKSKEVGVAPKSDLHEAFTRSTRNPGRTIYSQR